MASKFYKLDDINQITLKAIGKDLKNGAIAVIPTDTIYGIVGSVKIPKTVEKIYRLRKRTSSKPMIILVSSLDQIKELGVKITLKQINILKKLWPNKISIVFYCPSKYFHYLHRGKKSLAFRIPDNEFLIALINLTGPIVAPSANFEGEKSAANIEEAKAYFKDSVDFYIDAGELNSPPSTVLKLEKLNLTVLREGSVKIPKNF